MHWGAKTMSLIVGTSLVVLCLIALANGHGALGIFAANGLTELVWGAAGGLLIILSMLPRVGRKNQTVMSGPQRHAKPAASSPRRGAGQCDATRSESGQRGADRQGPTTKGAHEGSPVTPVSDTSDERLSHDRRIPLINRVAGTGFSLILIDSNKEICMADKHIDEGKGRVKEAAGSLTGDRDLKNEGKVDRGKATVKDKVDKVADTLSTSKKK